MSVVGKRTAEEAKLDEPMPAKRHKKNKNYYDIFGDDAKVEIEIRRDKFKREIFLRSKDFHSLLLWMLGEIVSPNWLFIKHRPLIEKVIIIQIQNLNETMIKSLKQHHDKSINTNKTQKNVNDDNLELFPFFNKNNYCPLQLDIPKFDKSTKHPSFKKLTVVAVDRIKGLSADKGGRGQGGGKRKRRRNNNTSNNKNNNNHNNKNGLSSFITSVFGNKYKYYPEIFISSQEELKRNKFPTFTDHQNRYQHFFQLPSSKCNDNDNDSSQIRIDDKDRVSSSDSNEDSTEEEDDDITSDSSDSATSHSSAASNSSSDTKLNRNIEKMVGLDCEMVCTKKGIELARVSIVSEAGECIYDELVKPSEQVTDYCTKWSGITASMLENVTKTLSDIQLELRQFMDSSTIICGHGLENDLLALELVHYRCIDTTILYPSSSPNFKNKLRYLASKFLKRNIQQSHDGHNSHEDALAALDLVKLKV